MATSEDISEFIEIDGISRPTRNSLSKLIHPKEDGIVNFWRWFGDSSIVDKAGRPQVMFHGSITWEKSDGNSLGDIDSFDRLASVTRVGRRPSLDTIGIWFSDNAGSSGAELYAGNQGVIYPCYLRIIEPKRSTFRDLARNAYEFETGKAHSDCKVVPKVVNVEPYREFLVSSGHDGVRVIHDEDRESTEFLNQTVFIVFTPEQIKSAVGNSGLFSTNCPSLTDISDEPLCRPGKARP